MDGSLVGTLGTLSVATRGVDGPGEVLLRVRGGTETYLARSDEPLARGTAVLVVADLGGRSVTVIPFSP